MASQNNTPHGTTIIFLMRRGPIRRPFYTSSLIELTFEPDHQMGAGQIDKFLLDMGRDNKCKKITK